MVMLFRVRDLSVVTYIIRLCVNFIVMRPFCGYYGLMDSFTLICNYLSLLYEKSYTIYSVKFIFYGKEKLCGRRKEIRNN